MSLNSLQNNNYGKLLLLLSTYVRKSSGLHYKKIRQPLVKAIREAKLLVWPEHFPKEEVI